MRRLFLAVTAFALAVPLLAADPPKAKPPAATPADKLKVAKDFKVELLYSVPKETHGSWVCMTTLPGGKLVVSDQYDKGLFVVTPPPVGKEGEPKVEPLKLEFDGKPFGMAQGLCWAFDSLYVVVNGGTASGLYRVTASKKGGDLDTVELLRKFEGHGGGGLGEHGPHAVLKHPDGKRLTVVCGNQTKLTKYDTTRVPPHWGEDHLLPRLPDGNGFMAGVNGPGGAMYNVTPDGKEWELFSVGFRNEYDAAYDTDGELFTYDADMEWDFNTPWYRPTRICQVTSGSEFGWRNGAGKYPAYYLDNLPGICDIGPGSPTGVAFGTGAKFPKKYQKALFACDWSYGKLYAVHLEHDGSHKKGTAEEFISGAPLPLTDLVVGEDGALYFTTGGRRVQSGLYRVTYTGAEAVNGPNFGGGPRGLARQEMEQFHHTADAKAIDIIWLRMSDPDRFLRFAARVALEHQDPKLWAEKALNDLGADRTIPALLALTRVSASCPQHDPERKRKGDPELRAKILTSLARFDFAKLSTETKIDLIRVYHVLFNRFGPPTDAERKAWLERYEPAFPVGQRYVDGELLQVFCYLQADTAAAVGVKLLEAAPTQEEQLEYARALRVLKTGWTPDLRKRYFDWFTKALTYKGGNSFARFVSMVKFDAIATLSDAEQVALVKSQVDAKQPFTEADKVASMKVVLNATVPRFTDADRMALVKGLLEAKVPDAAALTAPPRKFVKKHTLNDLAPAIEKGIAAGGRDYEKGRKLFAATNCFGCHRFDQEGGSAGPDLTGVSGRFSQKDLLESVLDPSKEVSDQYQAMEIDLLDGKKVSGRIVNLNGDNIMVLPNMLDPNGIVTVSQKNVDRITPSKVSMMPSGLLDTLTDDEAVDLMAYLLSKGDRKHPAFWKK